MAKDNWSSEAYSGAASFVPQLTTKVLQYLDPQPTDNILDIGCGDGVLNDKIAPLCKTIIGLDSSASMIKTANETVKAKYTNAQFFVADCRRIVASNFANAPDHVNSLLGQNHYDKIFSNAAMHWILRDENTRVPFFSDVYGLLKPGGTFVFEMGGFQNVLEAHTAFYAVLILKYGRDPAEVRAADPWFFPSTEWMRATLEDAGFAVEVCEMEHRPTKLTDRSNNRSGGFEGWVHLMGAPLLEILDERDRDEAVRAVCQVTSQGITKIEDDSQWLSYVRLRAVARKKS